MAIAEEIKSFVFRKRQWRWLIVAALIALTGQLLEGQPVLQPLIRLTGDAKTSLESIQPFRIAKIFDIVLQLRRPADSCIGANTSNTRSCNPMTVAAELALQNIQATPEVAREVWTTTDTLGRIVFVFTLATILLGVIFVVRYRSAFGGGPTAMLMLLSVIGMGQWVVGGMFWLLLQSLILLAIVFGAALGGIAWAALNLFGFYKAAVITLGVVTQADSFETKAQILAREIDERKRD
jgi:hypothetical protein